MPSISQDTHQHHRLGQDTIPGWSSIRVISVDCSPVIVVVDCGQLELMPAGFGRIVLIDRIVGGGVVGLKAGGSL